MDKKSLKVRPQLGLQTVYESPDPTVDIIAVHGLGSTHPWEGETPDSSKSSPKYINWLSHPDMLPSHVPNSRIMTFNYESAWLYNAPKQTRMNCGISLYNAIEDERCRPRQIESVKNRPIVFIGHSFGGVAIEEALTHRCHITDEFDIITLTAGIVFLGTPHRGSSASSWASILVKIAGILHYDTKPRILKDLEEFSETMKDLIYRFSLVVHDNQMPIFCFFERHPTDLGKRAIPWFRGVVAKVVVSEESACLDCARKQGLAADHMSMAKFSGPSDANYNAILPEIKRLVGNATFATRMRITPREYNQDIGNKLYMYSRR